MEYFALTGVDQWVDLATNLKVTSSSLDQGTCLVAGQAPGWGVSDRQRIDGTLSDI